MAIIELPALPPLAQPSLHSAHAQRRGQRGPFHRGEVEIAFPVANVGANLPALLATVAGNLFELGEITGLRLLDIDLPPELRFGENGRAEAPPDAR